MGAEEFERLHTGVAHALQTAMSRPGHGAQILFAYDNENITQQIARSVIGCYGHRQAITFRIGRFI